MKQRPLDERQRLVDLGPERLADALLALAQHHPRAEALVTRLTAPSTGLRRVRAKLAGLGRRTRFVGWAESAAYAEDLQEILADIEAGTSDPKTGVELVAAFYRADAVVFEACDDSSGHVGDVFRGEGLALFTRYAAACPDKEWLAELVLELVLQDDYGVRSGLLDTAAQYLPAEAMRRMVDGLWPRLAGSGDEGLRPHAAILIEALARQLGDPALFERTRLTSWKGISPAACKDIAVAYLDAGDAGTALSWLQRLPPETGYLAHEYDELLLRVQHALGNREEQAQIAWRLFRAGRSQHSLEVLLSVIGPERRDEVVKAESIVILASTKVVLDDAQFLVDIGRLQDCAQYLLARRDQLNGDQYYSLVPLAEAMEQGGEALTATVVYRALLEPILARAQSRYYHHGARYLGRLEALSAKVAAWQGIATHEDYAAQLRQVHARKSAFWAKCRSAAADGRGEDEESA